MIGALWSAVNGMRAMEKKVEVSANNVANVNTDGFKKSRASVVEDKSGNPRVIVDKVDIPGYKIREMTDEGPKDRELSNVDLAEELTEQIVAEKAYTSNLKTMAAVDEMLGQLIKTKA